MILDHSMFITIKGCKKTFTATKMAITQLFFTVHIYVHVTPINESEI